MKIKILIVCLLSLYSFSGICQFESQFMKTHQGDYTKTIHVWYFDYGTKIDIQKHQGYRFYTFDTTGNLLEKKCYDKNDSLIWKNTFTYDSLNRVIKEIFYFREEGESVQTYSYDKNNNQNSESTIVSNIQDGVSNKFITDKDENIIEVITLSNDIQIDKDIYQYSIFDNKNNWLKMTWSKANSNKPSTHYIRKLSYFK